MVRPHRDCRPCVVRSPLSRLLSPLSSRLFFISPLTCLLSPLSSLFFLTSLFSPLSSHLSPLFSPLSSVLPLLSHVSYHPSYFHSRLSSLTPPSCLLSPPCCLLSPLSSFLSPLSSLLFMCCSNELAASMAAPRRACPSVGALPCVGGPSATYNR
jgi:hypothetical protein